MLPCPQWGDPEHHQHPGHPDSIPPVHVMSSPFSCLIPDVDISDRKQIGFFSSASRVSFLANLSVLCLAGLWLLVVGTGKACAGGSLPIVRQSPSAGTAPRKPR